TRLERRLRFTVERVACTYSQIGAPGIVRKPFNSATRRKEETVRKDWLIGLALTAMAGCVDAIGYLRLGGLFPSFMSGNTTQLGISLADASRTAALPAMLIALFVA